MNAPQLAVVGAEPAPVTPERWHEFLQLVLDTRTLQQLYRRTMDPIIRRESEKVAQQLDAAAGFLVADLAAVAVQAEAEVTTEGGAA